MEQWANKVAVLTSSGNQFGIQIIDKLGKAGMKVIGLCRTNDELIYIMEKLKHINRLTGNVSLKMFDANNIEDIDVVFESIASDHGSVDVLINIINGDSDSFIQGKCEDFKKLVDMNVVAVTAGIRKAAGIMIQKQIRGHIVTISYCQGRKKLEENIYEVTKSAISSVNEILRHEFRYLKANIKSTHIDIVNSKEFDVTSKIDKKDLAAMGVQDLVAMVVNILSTPENVQIHELWLDIATE